MHMLGKMPVEICADAESGMAHSLRTGIQVAEELRLMAS